MTLPLRRIGNESSHPCRQLDFESHPFERRADELFFEALETLQNQGMVCEEDLTWLDSLLVRLYEHDPITLTHSMTVGLIAYGIARKRDHDLDMQAKCLIIPTLHDIGKVHVPRHILRASPEEWKANKRRYWKEVKKHVWHGYKILSQEDHPYAKTAAKVALMHHLDQKRSYPSPVALLNRWIFRPWNEEFRRILFYTRAGDNIAASTRTDRAPLRLGSIPSEIDIIQDPEHPEPREARKERLMRDAPAIRDIIQEAFDGHIIV